METFDLGKLEAVRNWCVPPGPLDLAQNSVHLWTVSLIRASANLKQFQETLSPDERAKSARFRFLKDRNHYIVARGVLRDILGRYARQAPATLEFCYGPHGKPSLQPRSNTLGLHFNLSHADELALYAVTQTGEVGIDLERIKPFDGYDAIARRLFTKAEAEVLHALTPRLQSEAFFACWVRKEAYLKALGVGISLNLASFHVSFVQEQHGVIGNIEASACSIYSFTPAPGYTAALACKGKSSNLKFWKWSDPAPNRGPFHLPGGTRSLMENSTASGIANEVRE
jgi:4'-phosphopantetheinyl transferase